MKKDALKIVLITGTGLFMVLIGYPFLHELGHIIATVFVGAEVVELTLFPFPSVLCDVSGIETEGLVIIGLGGMYFPLLVSFGVPRRWFIGWCVKICLQGISVIAMVISCVSVLFSINRQDDMIQVLRFWEAGKEVILLTLCSGVILTLAAISIDRPRHRICEFFGV